LQRQVWGAGYYDRHRRPAPRPRHAGLPAIALGLQLLLIALGIAVFTGEADAHTGSIRITCTAVVFSYDRFPNGDSATVHETVSIDGALYAQRDFVFVGPSASDSIPIALGPGEHFVVATAAWRVSKHEEGFEKEKDKLKHCQEATTTTTKATTTTAPESTTSTSVPAASTTTSTVPGETSTSMPSEESSTTTSSTPAETTTTLGSTTSTLPSGTTSVPVTVQGSTTTLLSGAAPTTGAGGSTSLPRTGTDARPAAFALAMIGLGFVAAGLARRQRARDASAPVS
jgi:hypothetical protein